jgi:hypothetical protein
MFDPFEVNRIGNIYVEERVMDAKNGRAMRRGRKNGLGLVQRVRDFMIAADRKLAGQPQSGTIPLTVAKK